MITKDKMMFLLWLGQVGKMEFMANNLGVQSREYGQCESKSNSPKSNKCSSTIQMFIYC